jgi:hypothetical protein
MCSRRSPARWTPATAAAQWWSPAAVPTVFRAGGMVDGMRSAKVVPVASSVAANFLERRWSAAGRSLLRRAIAGVLVLYRRGKRVRRGGTARQRGKSDKGRSGWWEPRNLSSDPSSYGCAPARNWQPGDAISRISGGGNEGGGHGVFIGANSGANRNIIGPKHGDRIGFGQQNACRSRPPGEDALTGGPWRLEKKIKEKEGRRALLGRLVRGLLAGDA